MQQATVIGAQGFIGSHLVSHLRAQGWQVWAPAKGDPAMFGRELGHVFYCAGLTADYLQRPYDTVEAHVGLLNRLLQQARWQGLVYLSSTRVYDGLPLALADESVSLSLNPANPRHLYDLSKLLGESLCLQSGRASIARLSCVYQDERDQDGFLPALLRRVLQARPGGTLHVESSPHFARDYVWLGDVLRALPAIARHPQAKIFNVASGCNTSNADLFALMQKSSGVAIVCDKNDQPGACARIDVRAMHEHFSWQARPVLTQVETILTKKSGEQ